jgi:hypothetical protein
MISDPMTTIKIVIGLGFLWFLWYRCFRPTILEEYRFELFKARDRLFAYAAEGNIRFDSETYIELRESLNRMIRFAHRLSVVRIIVIAIQVIIWPCPLFKVNDPLMASSLSEEQKKGLSAIRNDAWLASLAYVIFRSPLLLLAVMPLALIGYLAGKLENLSIRRSLPPMLGGSTQVGSKMSVAMYSGFRPASKVRRDQRALVGAR